MLQYIVTGQWNLDLGYDGGETKTWPVVIYPEKEQAREHARLANNYIREYKSSGEIALYKNPYDRTGPDLTGAHDDINYDIEEVETHGTPEDYLRAQDDLSQIRPLSSPEIPG